MMAEKGDTSRPARGRHVAGCEMGGVEVAGVDVDVQVDGDKAVHTGIESEMMMAAKGSGIVIVLSVAGAMGASAVVAVVVANCVAMEEGLGGVGVNAMLHLARHDSCCRHHHRRRHHLVPDLHVHRLLHSHSHPYLFPFPDHDHYPGLYPDLYPDHPLSRRHYHFDSHPLFLPVLLDVETQHPLDLLDVPAHSRHFVRKVNPHPRRHPYRHTSQA